MFFLTPFTTIKDSSKTKYIFNVWQSFYFTLPKDEIEALVRKNRTLDPTSRVLDGYGRLITAFILSHNKLTPFHCKRSAKSKFDFKCRKPNHSK